MSEFGGLDPIGFINSGYECKYLKIWCQYSFSHNLVTKDNCKISYIALDWSDGNIGFEIESCSYSHTMEQMRRQIREMLAVRQALINRRELAEAVVHCAKMQPFWAHRKLFATLDADREEWKTERKAFNEMLDRREA
jgi:hypothetical protein